MVWGVRVVKSRDVHERLSWSAEHAGHENAGDSGVQGELIATA